MEALDARSWLQSHLTPEAEDWASTLTPTEVGNALAALKDMAETAMCPEALSLYAALCLSVLDRDGLRGRSL